MNERFFRMFMEFHMPFINSRRIVVWGTGSGGEQISSYLLRLGIDIAFYVAKDFQETPIFFGKDVKDKNVLNNKGFYIIVATMYYKEVALELEKLGFIPKYDYLMTYNGICSYDLVLDGISVGRQSYGYEAFFEIWGKNSILKSIGRYTSINIRAYMHSDHSLNRLSTGELGFDYSGKYHSNSRKAEIVIGNDVWIGANSFINASKVAVIGDGAIIAAGAVVLRDVPPYAVVAGVPARIIKYRYSEKEIEILERIKWWEWEVEKIKEYAECFYNNKLFFETFG